MIDMGAAMASKSLKVGVEFKGVAKETRPAFMIVWQGRAALLVQL